MASLTVAVDDVLLHRAHTRALDNGTSANALIRSYLKTYAGDDEMEQRREIVRIARGQSAGHGRLGRHAET